MTETASTSDAALTKNEAVVMGALRSAGRALTAYGILEKTMEHGIRAPTQVYRALDGLGQRGLVHRVETLNAYLVCARGPHTDDAAFAVCQNCGLVEEIPLVKIAPELKRLAGKLGFALRTTRVELSGLCRACRVESGTGRA